MLKHETSGPKLFVHGENTINAFHDQLLLNGLDQSVTPSDSPLLKQKIVEFKNLCFKSEKGLTTENLSRSEKNNPSEFKTPKDVSLFKELRRLKLVKIAINKLNNLNTSGFVQRLRKINYQIIGDNAQDFNETSSLQKSSRLQYLTNSWKRIPILDPSNRFKLIWDFFILLLVFSNMIYFSLELTFEPNFEPTIDSIYNSFTIVVLAFDVIIKFKTSFYEHGTLWRSHSKIRKYYFKADFFVDMTAFAVLILHETFASHTYFKWLILLFFGKIKSIKKIFQNYESFIDFGEISELFFVMLKVLCVVHIYACFWHYISYDKSDPQKKNTWISEQGLDYADWHLRYLYSMYWALATMVTVGYGDITPQNPSEVSFCSFTILSGSVMFGYCLNKIGTLMANIDERDKELKKNIKLMENYMKKHNITGELKGKAIKFLEFNWKSEGKNLEMEQGLLDTLPDSLKNEIMFESNKKSLMHFKILRNNFTEEIINKLSTTLRTTQFSPNELIYCKGDYDVNNPSLYLIVDGTAQVLFNGRILRSFNKEESFGDFEFFCNLPYQETITSSSFTIVYKIPLKIFIQTLKPYPEQYEKFCQIKDHLFLNNIYTTLHSRCISCSQDTHSIYHCPLITPRLNSLLTIQRLLYSKPQIRQHFERKSCKNSKIHSLNALMSFQKIQFGVYKARFNNVIMSCFQKTNVEANADGSVETDEELFNQKNNCDFFSLQSFTDYSKSGRYTSLRRSKSAEVLSEVSCADNEPNPIFRSLDKGLEHPKKLTKVVSKKTISFIRLDERNDSKIANRCKSGGFSIALPSGEGEEENVSLRRVKTRSTLRMATKHKKQTLNASKNKLPKIEEADDNSKSQTHKGSYANFEDEMWKERERKYTNTLKFEEADGKEHRQRSPTSTKRITKIKDSSYETLCNGENGSSFENKVIRLLNEKKSTAEELMTQKIRTGTKKDGETEEKNDLLKKKKENYGKYKGIGLYDYEFEVLCEYKNYCIDGNCRNIINTIERKYFLKQRANKSPKIFPGMSPRASKRKKIQFSRNSKKF